MSTLNEKDKRILEESIRNIPNFPKEGIVFKDISTLLNNNEALKTLMNHLEERYKSYNLDYVAGIDARGFIFGSILADRLNIGFVPVRKKGKLEIVKPIIEKVKNEGDKALIAFTENLMELSLNIYEYLRKK